VRILEFAISVFLFNSGFDFWADLALSTALFGVEVIKGVRSDKEFSIAQWAVLWASHFSSLLVVSVSTDSTDAVLVVIVSIDNNTGSISGNLDTASDDLDSTVQHQFNGANVFLGLLVSDHFGEISDDLVVQHNLEVSLAKTHEGGQWGNGDFVLSSKENCDSLALSVDILDKDGEWVLSGAVLGEEVGAASCDFLAKVERDIVEGGNPFAFNGAGLLGIELEGTVTDVLNWSLSGGEWEEFLGPDVGLDVSPFDVS